LHLNKGFKKPLRYENEKWGILVGDGVQWYAAEERLEDIFVEGHPNSNEVVTEGFFFADEVICPCSDKEI
jgi:hypothetical protein